MNRRPKVAVVVDYTKKAGEDPDLGKGLDRNFLSGFVPLVAATIAALYNNPNDEDGNRLTTSSSRAMVQLALYCTGGYVSLTTQDYRRLERCVRHYASRMRQTAQSQHLAYARYVLRHAERRAQAESVI